MTQAFVALGSNLAQPMAQIDAAYRALKALPQTHWVASSSLYRTAPVGYANQPDFINAVVELDTQLAPHALLTALQHIEYTQGRARTFANAPRTLDLDLLWYGDQTVQDAILTLPHPRMHERAFVLAPLAELAPTLDLRGHGQVEACLARCIGQDIVRLPAAV